MGLVFVFSNLPIQRKEHLILPKNERKQFDLRYHSSKVELFRSVFGRIEDTKRN